MGLGLIGMSGNAELPLNLGYPVSGSDLVRSEITDNLTRLGGTVYVGHAAEHISDADVVVVSSAIDPGNPETRAAQDAGLPVIPRAEMLAELMRLKYSIAIAGAHGKTSTTSLVASVLAAGNLDPTVVIGGKLMGIGTNAVLGKGEFIVAEADESDGSFLKFSPAIAVVTNIDREHLDFYSDMDHIKSVFLEFIDRSPFYGLAVLCLDNEPVQELLPKIKRRHVTYGLSAQADLRATAITFRQLQSHFNVRSSFHGDLGQIVLNRPGLHNVYNALASVAVGLELGVNFEAIAAALASVKGVQRRLEIKAEVDGITVIDDYGHHPTEIKSTLEALRNSWPSRRIVVVFQPHRFTRTQALFDEFTRAFYQCDILVVMPIYPASEAPIAGVSGQRLYEGIKEHGHKDVRYADNAQAVIATLLDTIAPGDLVLTLGAGDVYKVGEDLVNRFGNGAVVRR